VYKEINKRIKGNQKGIKTNKRESKRINAIGIMAYEAYEMTSDEAGGIASMKTMLLEEKEEETIIMEGLVVDVPVVKTAVPVVKTPVPDGVYSAFIPWAENWVGEDMVRKELGECGWGEIKKVDFVKSHQKREHWKVYIHFTRLPEEVKLHLENGNHVKVYYKGTYYWKVFKSKYVHKEAKLKYELSK